MVNVADEEEFETFKEHVDHCRLAYKIDEVEKEKFKVIIQGGKLAWEGTVTKEEKDKIVNWLKARNAMRIKKSIRDDLLFAG